MIHRQGGGHQGYPIGERGGLNLYTMFGNGAVNAWDYLGLVIAKCNKGERRNCVSGAVTLSSPDTLDALDKALATADAAEVAQLVDGLVNVGAGALSRNVDQAASGLASLAGGNSGSGPSVRGLAKNIGAPHSDRLARAANQLGAGIGQVMYVTIHYWECESILMGCGTKWNTNKSNTVNCGSGLSESQCRGLAFSRVCP